jgi:hypothetical protein
MKTYYSNILHIPNVRGSCVVIMIRLRAGKPRTRGSSPARGNVLHTDQTGSGTHPYSMGAEGPFTGLARPECEDDHSTPSTADVWLREAISPLHHTSSRRGAQFRGETTLPLSLYTVHTKCFLCISAFFSEYTVHLKVALVLGGGTR